MRKSKKDKQNQNFFNLAEFSLNKKAPQLFHFMSEAITNSLVSYKNISLNNFCILIRFEEAPATTLTDDFHLLTISWQDGGVFFSLDNEVYFPQDEQVSFSQPVSFSVHIFCELTEFTNITASKPTVEFDYIRVYTSTDSKSLNSEILKASGNDLIQTEDKFSNNLFFWTGLGGTIFIVAVLIAAVCFKRTRNTGN